jgi:peroxiredoxin
LLSATVRVDPPFTLGGPAPDIALRILPVSHTSDEAGELVRLSDLIGKVVVLDYWFTGCPPCVAEHATMNELAEAYETEGVEFFGITDLDTSSSLARFADRHGPFSYANLADRDKEAKRALRVPGWPTKIVIDRAGTVVWWRVGGPIERDVLAGVIEDALAGRRPTAPTKAVYPGAPHE